MEQRLNELIRGDDGSRGIDSGAVVGRYVRGPVHTELLRLLNRFKVTLDPAARDDLRHRIDEHFIQFGKTNGDGHPNGAFVLLAMQGGIVFTVEGDAARALELAERSLEVADTSWQRAIAYGNMSEACRHLRAFDRSIDSAMEAIRLEPLNEGFWVHLLLGLVGRSRDHRLDEKARSATQRSAREAFCVVRRRITEATDRTVWAKYLDSHVEFDDEESRKEFPEIVEIINAAARS